MWFCELWHIDFCGIFLILLHFAHSYMGFCEELWFYWLAWFLKKRIGLVVRSWLAFDKLWGERKDLVLICDELMKERNNGWLGVEVWVIVYKYRGKRRNWVFGCGGYNWKRYLGWNADRGDKNVEGKTSVWRNRWEGGGMVNYLHFAHSWRDFAKSWVLLFGIIYEVL